MGLLSKLKSLLGADGDGESRGSGVDVTVEREPSADSERAVEDADTGGDDEAGTEATDEADSGAAEADAAAAEADAPADEDAGEEDPVAAETDAAASTESLVDEDHAEDPTRAAEPAEAAVTGGEDDETAAEPSGGEDGEADAEAEPSGGEDDEADAEPSGGEAEPVSSVKGIGPAYAERLADAGVETVADLAAADPEEVAEATDLSAKRVGRWVESARDRN
ncbi:helix-hairpin-helix domain-containing protein [Halobacterium yunchengense]|uniref:helix-hairpin-helix domain-containing protein n=1 Tax=Halobacterium yunchengense TaxID=3108497 RepID=UPI00300A9581